MADATLADWRDYALRCAAMSERAWRERSMIAEELHRLRQELHELRAHRDALAEAMKAQQAAAIAEIDGLAGRGA